MKQCSPRAQLTASARDAVHGPSKIPRAKANSKAKASSILPITLLRLLKMTGAQNLGVNFDPANLIAYGKGNPIDAVDTLGPYIRNVHVKDALYPDDPMNFGHEVKVGTGHVRFPEFVRKLAQAGFRGEFIIERETSGEEQQRDILATIQYLNTLLEAP